MKTIKFVLLALMLMAVLPVQAKAETTIAIVDVQRIMSEAKAAKSVQKQLDSYREKFLSQISKEEQALREKEKALVEQKSSLSAEEFGKKRKEFEQSILDTRKSAQTKKKNLDEAAGKALNKLRDELFKVVQSIAKEKSLQLVLSGQSVVLAENALDITADVLKGLDKALSDVKLEVKE